MTGDVTIRRDADVLIMTTEIFRNSIFEGGSELHDVGYVIYDEIHYMDDLERGTVWEESIIFAPETVRFLALSATVSNLKQFCSWISQVRGREMVRIESRDRPVPLADYLHFPDLGPRRFDKVKALPRLDRRSGSRSKRGARSNLSRADSLLDRLEREQSLPVLFFCFSRRECESRARDHARRRLLDSGEREEMEALFDDICDRFEIQPDVCLEELRALALSGIAYHHAGLLPLHKELVERLFTSGLLKLLFTTETFALGINMPARSVIFSSLRKFDGVTFDRLKARDYQQMAGRAGRQGIDSQGLVYSIIDDRRLKLPDLRSTIRGSIEPIRSRFKLSYSTLLNLHDRLGPRIYEAWEKSFNNFQWARMSSKKREKNERRQRMAIQSRLRLLEEFEYLDAERVLEKGDCARRINGYELPVVELVSSGLFRVLDHLQVALILTAVVFEERKADLYQRMPPHLLREHRRDAEAIVEKIVARERELGIHPQTRRLNFKIGSVVHAWWEGWSFEDISGITNASHGDLVRTFRQVVQLLRQMRKVYGASGPTAEHFDPVIEHINRDEVDARRQIELGEPERE
jgi:superfamily II RNA helicase